MLLWFFVSFILAFVLIAIFVQLGANLFQAYVYAMIIILLLYYAKSMLHRKKSLDILDEACDPEEFLNRTLKQKQVMRRRYKKIQVLLSIDEAVGYMLLGDYLTGREILKELDKRYLSEKDTSLLIYTIDYIICCFELGDFEEAFELMETKLPGLAPLNKRLKRSIEILIGDRYYYLGRYDESYEHLSKLLDIELNRRQNLSILYRLAQIDVLRGDDALATKKYQKIAKFGNTLGIATQARKYLEEKQGHNQISSELN